MILLWGIPADTPLRATYEALVRAAARVVMLDQFDTARMSVRLTIGRETAGILLVDGTTHDLAAVTALYQRPYDGARVLCAAGNADEALRDHAIRFNDVLLCWSELTDALVVNRPSAMASNGSKPLQAALIEAAGFATPQTLLTTDADEAAAFRARYGQVIYKSASGVRSRVALLDDSTLRRIAGAACAIQLQEYISGTDMRVHVVGDATFACTIDSSATDYRYPGETEDAPRLENCALPAEIATRAVALTRALGLVFSGVDLRRADDGRWICFEANPSPGFTYYEDGTGAPIADALASLLARGAAADCVL
jgi:glutathione synthase/RimK-type ligase-like ATP-grasp enzyme